MIIFHNYAQAISNAKANNESQVNFNKPIAAVEAIPSEKDTVTLSDKALAMMRGQEYSEEAPIYVRPQTSRSLLATNETQNTVENTKANEEKALDTRFSEMMQTILDKRLGIDSEKLEEIEAMMEQVANDDSLSPKAKKEALEKLEEMREQIFKESREILEATEKTD
jgi:hypothetical protein